MLTSAGKLAGYKLGAVDGEFGKVKDFYFDDETWTVRYLVADTGGWLPGLQVLISPFALKSIDHDARQINVSLTKAQIERSPSIDADKPVSRQFELAYSQYFGWPMYWYGPSLWGPAPFPVFEGHVPPAEGGDRSKQEGDPHLRSTSEVRKYHLRAKDHDIGHVEDFILEDENWAIRYLVADTRNWWPGKKVLLSPQWIERVTWNEALVYVDLLRDTIKAAPEYTADMQITREFESALFEHYEKDPYWTDHMAHRPKQESAVGL